MRARFTGRAEGRAASGRASARQRIAANPPLAVRATKRLLREGRFASLDALLQISANAQAIAHTTEEHRQALAAALSKAAKR